MNRLAFTKLSAIDKRYYKGRDKHINKAKEAENCCLLFSEVKKISERISLRVEDKYLLDL